MVLTRAAASSRYSEIRMSTKPRAKTEAVQPAKKSSSPESLRWPHRLAVAGCVLGGIIIVAEAGALYLDRAYTQTITPGVRIGRVAVGSQRYLETVTQVKTYADSLTNDGLTFIGKDKTLVVSSASVATDDPDLAASLIDFDPKATVDAAYAIGRSGGFWSDLRARALALVGRTTVPIEYEMDDTRVLALLRDAFLIKEIPAIDATFTYSGGHLGLMPESIGERFDYDRGLAAAREAVEGLIAPVRIELSVVPDQPTVTKTELQPLLDDAETMLKRGPVTLKTSKADETIPTDELATWFVGKRQNGNAILGFGSAAVDEFLADLAGRIDVAPVEGRYEYRDGALSELTAGQPGTELDQAATLAAMEAAYLRQSLTEAAAVMAERAPVFSPAAASGVSALQLLGTGHSNFSGSPNNRRHNIATGAAALHGLVIPPDQEFSLAAALGPIEKETGYLPELVIKGDKTVPEYGGGLCQIGTTTFRAAMGAALPVTERRNHSYSVGYYLENGLPGTDATIYPPHPDIRFLNDTGSYILIQVRTEGNDLYFDFYGKPDGRTAERTTPRIWDRVSPPPTKEIETTDLAPGERKCTEKAHTGLKTEFTYTIHYPNGDTKEQAFQSTYKPWQEVCLIGKAA